jgi:hypothetical protein
MESITWKVFKSGNFKKSADIQIDSTKLNLDSVKLTADTIKENLNHVEVSKDIASGLINITKVVTNLDKDLGIVKAVNTNNVNTYKIIRRY